MFPQCSHRVATCSHRMFPQCSRFVPALFPLCSRCVPALFPLCSRCVPAVFPLCSRCVPALFPLCSRVLPRVPSFLPLFPYFFHTSAFNSSFQIEKPAIQSWRIECVQVSSVLPRRFERSFQTLRIDCVQVSYWSFDLAGVRAKISTALKSGAVTLKQNQVILWHKDGASFAGKALFFAKMEGDLVVIYECFRELASAVPFTKIFHITGEKGAVLLSNMEHIAHPTWWALDAQTVTCLL